MNLDEAQRKRVSEWIAEGQKLSDIQKRLASELGISMTYMEVRLLVDDLKLVPKDIEPPKAPALEGPGTSVAGGPGAAVQGEPPGRGAVPRPTGGVSVTVAEIARPGAVVSGTVTFSDGNAAEWHLDDTGRLGLIPKQAGYRPSQQDVQAFQAALQSELARMGF